MTSVGVLISQQLINAINNPEMVSYTDKTWAREYHSIQNLKIHTVEGQDRVVYANFDGPLISLLADEPKRMGEIAQMPNTRFWRLETEADIEHWWHTEVSDVVLAAWANYPLIVQTCHTKPLTGTNIPENIDCTYSMYVGNCRVPVALGEMKRNLINRREWQTGSLGDAQRKLARELRG